MGYGRWWWWDEGGIIISDADMKTNYHYYYYIRDLRVFSRCEDVARDRNTRGTSSTDFRKRGPHTRGVYPTRYTSLMETARVKEDV